MVKASKPKKVLEPKVELPAGVVQDEQENTVAEAQAKPKTKYPGVWVKLSKADILDHSLAGNLIGHNPKTDEVILKDPDLVPPKVDQERNKIILQSTQQA